MSAKLIERGWQDMEAAHGGFCCDYHHQTYRIMYFAGAMRALGAISGWDPEFPTDQISVDPQSVADVASELTTEFQATTLEASRVATEVRH